MKTLSCSPEVKPFPFRQVSSNATMNTSDKEWSDSWNLWTFCSTYWMAFCIWWVLGPFWADASGFKTFSHACRSQQQIILPKTHTAEFHFILVLVLVMPNGRSTGPWKVLEGKDKTGFLEASCHPDEASCSLCVLWAVRILGLSTE